MGLDTLTIEQARNVEAGVETDAMVAEACGWKYHGTAAVYTIWLTPGGTVVSRPSTDPNVALEAGNDFGAGNGASVFDGDTANDWEAYGGDIRVRGPSLCVAICRAILVRHVLGREAKA